MRRDAAVRKRPVNLTLNEELVRRAKSTTDNLSNVVETLLAEYVEREQRRQRERSGAAERSAEAWNRFNDQHGSFADEHSTL